MALPEIELLKSSSHNHMSRTRKPGRALRVLALVPPEQSGRQATKYSFLSEELDQLASTGIEIHAVSPHLSRTRGVESLTLHPVPRVRDAPHLRRLVQLWFRKAGRALVRGKDLRESLWITQLQAVIGDCLQREAIDLIYSPFAWPKGTGGIPAASLANVPVVLSLRGADVLVEPSIGYGQALQPDYQLRISQALRSADHVIGVSQSLADRAVELGASASRVSVVLKGVNLERFVPADTRRARQSLGVPDRPTVLFVGNLIRRKGVDLLLQAVSLARSSLPDLQLVICGTGPEHGNLQRLISALDLESHIRFEGWVERSSIAQYFQACDVFVLPSLTEGSGNVLVEAAACAKPSIGTNVAGIPDYIDDGMTGFLFEKQNASDLAGKILKILTDGDLAARMGNEARRVAESNHRYDQMIASLVDIFDQVVAGKTGSTTCAPQSN